MGQVCTNVEVEAEGATYVEGEVRLKVKMPRQYGVDRVDL